MRVIVLGLRAIPGTAGGVESHCEHLYPLLAASGLDVEVLVRSAYVPSTSPGLWRGVRIRRLWSPRKSGLEAIVHTLLGVIYAAFQRPDILHIHSVGPAILTPLARLLGLRVVVTCHAPDYMQAKWGRFAKWILRSGERMAMRYAHEVVSVSRHGAATLERSYGRAPTIILNGVPKIDPTDSVAVLDELRLTPGRYVLHVGRAIVDKRQDDLIRAFGRAGLKGWKLVLVGDLSGEDAFSRAIRLAASDNPDIVLAGFRCGVDLRALFTNAGGFALPSVIEGFPIALLEALSAGCPAIASDIPANHEIELPTECYFPVGDIEAMASALSRMTHAARSEARAVLREKVRTECDWAKIAQQTLRLYIGSIENKKLRASPAQRQRQ